MALNRNQPQCHKRSRNNHLANNASSRCHYAFCGVSVIYYGLHEYRVYFNIFNVPRANCTVVGNMLANFCDTARRSANEPGPVLILSTFQGVPTPPLSLQPIVMATATSYFRVARERILTYFKHRLNLFLFHRCSRRNLTDCEYLVVPFYFILQDMLWHIVPTGYLLQVNFVIRWVGYLGYSWRWIFLTGGFRYFNVKRISESFLFSELWKATAFARMIHKWTCFQLFQMFIY